MVQRVESFKADIERAVFCQIKDTAEGGIDIEGAWRIQPIVLRVPEGAERVGDKGRARFAGVQVLEERLGMALMHVGVYAGRVGTVFSDAGQGVICSRMYGEGQAALVAQQRVELPSVE